MCDSYNCTIHGNYMCDCLSAACIRAFAAIEDVKNVWACTWLYFFITQCVCLYPSSRESSPPPPPPSHNNRNVSQILSDDFIWLFQATQSIFKLKRNAVMTLDVWPCVVFVVNKAELVAMRVNIKIDFELKNHIDKSIWPSRPWR